MPNVLQPVVIQKLHLASTAHTVVPRCKLSDACEVSIFQKTARFCWHEAYWQVLLQCCQEPCCTLACTLPASGANMIEKCAAWPQRHLWRNRRVSSRVLWARLFISAPLLFYLYCLLLLCVECESERVSLRRSATFLCMYPRSRGQKANFTLHTNSVMRSISVYLWMYVISVNAKLRRVVCQKWGWGGYCRWFK